MPIKLNPCRVCGGGAERRWVRGSGRTTHYVCCQKCFTTSHEKASRDKADAAWNAANPIDKKEAKSHE